MSALVALVATTVLLGWMVDSETLKRAVVSPIIMLPLTALGFLLAAAALFIQTMRAANNRLPWYSRLLPGFVLCLGGIMLAQRIGGFELRINLLMFADALARYPFRPLGLMAGNSALSFTLLGAALCFRSADSRRTQPATALVLGVIGVATVALVGYAYGAHALYSVDQYAAMAVSTATCFLALGVGMILAEPLRGVGAVLIADDAGAVFTRKMLPIAVGVPFLLGIAWLVGNREEFFGRETGVALVVVAIAAIYTMVLFYSARSVSKLDRAVRDALAHAELARTRAEEANRGKAEFLTMMSHELRTPLNAIRGYTQLLELGVRGPITEEQRIDLARIRRSEEHLLGIIADILDFASVERGQYRFEIVPVSLPKILEEAIAAVMAPATNKHVRIEADGWQIPVEGSDALQHGDMVLADPQKLRQALINLLSHAIKFTEPFSQVTIALQQSKDHIVLSISDSGRGIPSDRVEKIFDAFTQVEPTLTRTSEGIGLGLAISRQLLRGMGSDIHVENSPGVGTRFSMHLRRAPKVVPAAPAVLDNSMTLRSVTRA